nr:histidine-rich glycoprotein [Anolis sagrei ordinatus]
MELLAVAVFLAGLICCHTESPPALAPADCNDAQVEKDAAVALDLINKHRRHGYIFTLLRVADAHVQQLENTSMIYFTLDVLDTECPIVSGKHWSSCGDRQFYRNTEFGQCKAVVRIHEFHKKLYGYNCTMSPVPSQLYECKDCPVRITVLEDAENYREEAQKLLEKYNEDSNQTHYFKLEKVQKIFMAIGSRTAYTVEFTIRETSCLRTTAAKQVSECEFLHGRDAHVGFCKGRLIKDTTDPQEVELDSCEIYDIPYGRHHFHHHIHNDSREHHHCNVSEHECRPPHHHHHPPHRHHHHHHHPHHHHHGHRHRCPPPSHHDHHGPRGPKDHHNSSEPSEGQQGLHPPPGPHHPPPPVGGPHHFPPSRYPSPPLGPPPPPPPRPPCPPGISCEHRPPPPPPPYWFHRHGNRRDHECNDNSSEQGRGSGEDHDSSRHHHPFHHHTSDPIYYIPVLSQHDVLQAPGADFLSHPQRPHGRPKRPHFPGKHIHDVAVIHPFPEILSESKSCPGKTKLDPPAELLSLYPARSTQ